MAGIGSQVAIYLESERISYGWPVGQKRYRAFKAVWHFKPRVGVFSLGKKNRDQRSRFDEHGLT
jgi:hypothetical protein